MAAEPVRHDLSPLRDADLHLFNEGTHHRLYERLGAQIVRGGEHGMAPPGDGEGRGQEGRQGDREPVITHFAVWAPNAREVSVVGDFNDWRAGAHALRARGGSGIWEGAVAGVGQGERYKYHVVSHTGDVEEKADPYAFATEEPPRTASVVWRPQHDWEDADWMERRGRLQAHDAPLSIYEVHLGSWQRPADGDGFLGYRELAHRLAEYVVDAGFTHVELMPVTEHPFYGSWGYQCTGYFAPTARHGRPDDFMYLVDVLHRHDIGVILDWVPSHFPTDAHGLGYFDGTHLYEHADPRLGMHPDWKSFIFNYGRHEVRSFLLSSALFWLDRYHVDGLRLDAVASMLYRDYSRQAGEWLPNRYGGRESLEAIDFLRQLNETVYERFPDVQTFAEESTAWPAVSRPTWTGGLGFGFKWDMGWMHDTLKYLAEDPVHRKYHHENLTFRMIYAWNENFVLPLSHDEVVHGKRSLAGKMPGDEWRKLANLRLLLGYMYAQPGKKLLFMGGEFGQWREWDHDDSLDWHLLDDPDHAGVRRWVQDLNRAYREIPALHQVDTEPQGFEWIDTHDARHSVLCFLRRDRDGNPLLVSCNFTPVPRHDYRVGAPVEGRWEEILNSDAEAYGGSGQGNLGGKVTDRSRVHGRPCSLALTLPPLGMVMLAPRGE